MKFFPKRTRKPRRPQAGLAIWSPPPRLEVLEDRTLPAGSLVGTAGHALAPHHGHSPTTASPPVATPEELALQQQEADEATGGPTFPPGGPAVTGTTPASNGGPSGLSGDPGPGGPQADSDFVFYRDQTLGNSSSVVGETGVADNGRAVFQTGNWYASVSGDNGAHWQYVNPYTTFPSSWGGFCCDQRATQVPSYNMSLWYLQYVDNGTTNGVRLAAAYGSSGLLDNSWTYWDFTPSSFGFAASNTQMDFPHMEVSTSYAYFSSNVYDLSSNYLGTAIWRVSLSQISAGGSINWTYWTGSYVDFSPCLTSNATSSMFMASVTGSNSLRVYEQPENTTTIYWQDVSSGLNTTYFATHNSITPDGYNWSSFSDSRIQTGWVSGSTVGFMWNSSQGTSRPQPFVRAVRFSHNGTASFSIIDQPDVWSGGDAWQYPSMSVDARGDIAGEVTYGGPGVYPQVNILIWDGYSPNPNSSGWENYFAQGGSTGGGNRWGDFMSSSPYASYPDTWMSGGWVSNSVGSGTPAFYWYGRQRDNPNLLTPTSDVGDTISTAQSTGVGPGTGSASFTGQIWSAAQGRKDVDMFSFFAVAGSSVTLRTFLPSGGQGMDTILRLFDSSGTQLTYDDDDPNGGTLYSGIYNYVLPKTGTFYVGVSGYSNFNYSATSAGSGTAGSIGDYTVYVAINSVPADVGDTTFASTATGVGPATGSYSHTSSIGDAPNYTKDVDMYSFYGVAGSSVTLRTTLPSGMTSMDTILRLFDSSGTQIALDDDDPNGGTLYSGIYNFVLPKTGTFYVGVSGYSNFTYSPTSSGSGTAGSTGDYTLSVSLTAPPDVPDVIGSALVTGLGPAPGTYSNTSSIGDAPNLGADVDMYQFQATAFTTLTATTSLPSGRSSMDTMLRLFDASGNLLASNDDDPHGGTLYSGIYNYVFSATGTYYIGVSGYPNGSYDPNTGSGAVSGSTGDYTLSLTTSRFGWATQDGTSTNANLNDQGRAVAVDSAGNTYVTGVEGGTASATETDIYVAQYDTSGNVVWRDVIGSTGNDAGQGIAVSGGNVYVTGYFSGSVNFNPAGSTILNSAGGTDAFVLKLTTAGSFVWAKRLGGTGADQGMGIALDSSGNVLTTGYFSGTADFNPGGGSFNMTSAGGTDIYVSKLTSGGAFTWAKQMGGSGADQGLGIDLDASNNVYTTGYFSGTADFDPSGSSFNMTSAGGTDIFVSKMTSAGAFTWAKQMGGPGADQGLGIAVSGSGVYTTGYFSGTADFNPAAGTFTMTSAGGTDAFVSKLTTGGAFGWAKQMGGSGADQGRAIAIGTDGSVLTTGTFSGTADFNPGAATYNQTSAGSTDLYVSRLNSSGAFVSATSVGNTAADFGEGITVDSQNNVYVTGGFRLAVTVNTGGGTFNLSTAGDEDILTAKFLLGAGVL